MKRIVIESENNHFFAVRIPKELFRMVNNKRLKERTYWPDLVKKLFREYLEKDGEVKNEHKI